MKLVNFLTAKVKAFVESLVKNVVAKMEKATTDDAILTVMVKAAVTVMHGFNMNEEIRLLGLLITCHYGGKGTEVPEAIGKLFASTESAPIEFPIKMVPAAVAPPAKPAVAVAPAPTPAKPAPVPATVPATVPARTITAEKSPEEKRNTLFSILQRFVSGKTIRVPETAGFIASIVESGTDSFSESQWQILLEAVKKAARVHLPLFGEEVATKIFDVVPIEFLSETVFGQDGLFVQISAQLSEVGDGKPMPRGLRISCLTLANAVDAIDDRQEDGLNDHEIGRVKKLIRTAELVGGPDDVISAFKSIVFDDDLDEQASATETVENGAARGVEALKALRSQLPVGNGHTVAEADRINTVAANAKASASAFAHAVRVN